MGSRSRLVLWRVAFLGAFWAADLPAQVCTGSASVGYASGSAVINAAPNCVGLFFCHPPVVSGAAYETLPPGCDPTQTTCTLRAVVPMQFPGNHGNTTGIGFVDSPVKLLWEDSQNQFVAACGNIGARIQDDDGETWIERSFTCGSTGGGDVYELQVRVCDSAPGCGQLVSVMVDLTDSALETAVCPVPPEEDCDDNCLVCRRTGGGDGSGGGSAAGGGGQGGVGGTGPGALLHYKAGSVGEPMLPGSPSPGLGAYWSHTYAGRLFEDMNPTPHAARVYFVTERAVYRTFIDDDGDGVYELVFPADDYRRLEVDGGGWTLTRLDGTVDTFDAEGFWLSRVDKNGNAITATYGVDGLQSVAFPDGRREDFAYDGLGMLASITEVGVDGATSRAWTYTWAPRPLKTSSPSTATTSSGTSSRPSCPKATSSNTATTRRGG